LFTISNSYEESKHEPDEKKRRVLRDERPEKAEAMHSVWRLGDAPPTRVVKAQLFEEKATALTNPRH
jgi:hypothetical protein